ncbi:MAG: hypothetical protein K0R39_3721 [Symbiobacteriaceae bacterium]|jgi:uncharacterized damage-inducible protein DinB|nr:hypothetical protein [Symbiobacteriaceae bacterium]
MGELLNPTQVLALLEGNRRLTVRVTEAFPAESLFTFKPTEALRPFSDLVLEILGIEKAYIHGIATGEWVYQPVKAATKEELLAACREVRELTRQAWATITAERLLASEVDNFFFKHPQANMERIWYALENEIHHRGQGYIYLRELGIEPPPFWER